MKRVLLTGASGFIGQHCLQPLVEAGFEVHAVSRSAPNQDDCEEVIWRRADLLDAAQRGALIDAIRPSHLLHLAWIVTPGEWATSADNLRWLAASIELAQRFEACGGRRLVVAGTCYEYDQNYGLCSEERTPTKPDTLYGASKLALCEALSAWSRTVDLSFAWPRVFFLYGPYEHRQRLASSVVCSLLAGEDAACSHGRQLRDYLYVKDAAEALVQLLDSEVSGPLNIGSGAPIALRDLVEEIGRQMDCPQLVKLGALPARETDVPLVMADAALLTQSLNWRPRYSLEGGVRETIAWWKQQLAPVN